MKFYLIAVFVSTLLFFRDADAAPKETSASASSEVVSREEITSESVCQMTKDYAEVNSVLATISRHPPSAASEIESNLSKINDDKAASANIKVFVGYAQTILKNRAGMRVFDFLERVGIHRFEELVCAKPTLFAPLFNSFERVLEQTAEDNVPVESQRSPNSFEVESPNEADHAPLSPLARFKQFVEVNTVLAKVARTSPEVISEIDSGITHLQKSGHAENTAFGKALGRMRILLKNHRSLAWFDFLDRAGVGKLEKLIVAKPEWFADRAGKSAEGSQRQY